MPKLLFFLILNKLIGTPYLLLNDLLEYEILSNCESECPNKSLNEVFPELPVIAIELIKDDFLTYLFLYQV